MPKNASTCRTVRTRGTRSGRCELLQSDFLGARTARGAFRFFRQNVREAFRLVVLAPRRRTRQRSGLAERHHGGRLSPPPPTGGGAGQGTTRPRRAAPPPRHRTRHSTRGGGAGGATGGTTPRNKGGGRGQERSGPASRATTGWDDGCRFESSRGVDRRDRVRPGAAAGAAVVVVAAALAWLVCIAALLAGTRWIQRVALSIELGGIAAAASRVC
jgi:hypothetical protein